MRDIKDYSGKYAGQGFEQYKVSYRRRKILDVIKAYHPEKILEIGCGTEPLFQYVEEAQFTIIEPAQDFYNNAVNLAGKDTRVRCIQGFFEEEVQRLSNDHDMIICASLLHEVEKPVRLLKAIAQVCNQNTIVHINVPNANSMHRLLGKEMKILADVHDMSENNRNFQQNNVFDKDSLSRIVTENGFDIIEDGSFFVKPFSHTQMYDMVQSGIVDEKVLDGLYALGKYMPEFGSEIYVNCRLKAVE